MSTASRAGAAPRVALADDHESVRLGLPAVSARDGFELVARAAGEDELISRLAGLVAEARQPRLSDA